MMLSLVWRLLRVPFSADRSPRSNPVTDSEKVIVTWEVSSIPRRSSTTTTVAVGAANALSVENKGSTPRMIKPRTHFHIFLATSIPLSTHFDRFLCYRERLTRFFPILHYSMNGGYGIMEYGICYAKYIVMKSKVCYSIYQVLSIAFF